jgi:uncharacterized membrane protein
MVISVRSAQADKPQVLKTSLSNEGEAKLKAALRKAA